MPLRSLTVLLFILFLGCTDAVPDTTGETAPPPTVETLDSLDLMIGQMMMVGFRGMVIDSVSPTIQSAIRSGRVGGIVLFDYDVRHKEFVRNIRSPEQLKTLVGDVQELSPQPLLMAIDQEGGRVNRLKSRYGFDDLASAAYLGELNDLDSTRHYAEVNASNLADLGFNVNFAPVVDLNVNPENPAIGKIERSYGAAVDDVVRHARAWIDAHAERNILSTLKHFPGHGSSTADSHEGITDVTATWDLIELQPFQRLLTEAPLTSIMTAHVYNASLDSLYPATLSEKVIKKFLREDFGYDGIVFSDDLQMGAIHQLFDFPTILERAILAGADVLVFGNNLEYDEDIPVKAGNIIRQLVEEGKIPEARIRKSYERIMATKGAI